MEDEKTNEVDKGGRPTDYEVRFNKMAFRHTLLGGTDKDLAELFEVNQTTIYEWKAKYPKFSKSIRKGKQEADGKVVQALYKRAIGYKHKEDKIFNNNGEALVVPTTKIYPPDYNSMNKWLSIRQRDKWAETNNSDLDKDETEYDSSAFNKEDKE